VLGDGVGESGTSGVCVALGDPIGEGEDPGVWLSVADGVGDGGCSGVWAFPPNAPTIMVRPSKNFPYKPARIDKWG